MQGLCRSNPDEVLAPDGKVATISHSYPRSGLQLKTTHKGKNQFYSVDKNPQQKAHYHAILSSTLLYHPPLPENVTVPPRVHVAPCLLHSQCADQCCDQFASECITLLTNTLSPQQRSRQACEVLWYTEVTALKGLFPSAASQP